MPCLFLFGALFAAVTTVTSGPVGKQLHARQSPNPKNPDQYCKQPVDSGGCPYSCELELNPWTNAEQLRCPCYSFCSSGYQVCNIPSYLAYNHCFTKIDIATSCSLYCRMHCHQIDVDDEDWVPECTVFKYPLNPPQKPQLPLSEIPVEDTQIASGSIGLDQSFALSSGGNSPAPQQPGSNLGGDTQLSDYDGLNGWTTPTDRSAIPKVLAPQVLASNIINTPSSNLNDLDIWRLD